MSWLELNVSTLQAHLLGTAQRSNVKRITVARRSERLLTKRPEDVAVGSIPLIVAHCSAPSTAVITFIILAVVVKMRDSTPLSSHSWVFSPSLTEAKKEDVKPLVFVFFHNKRGGRGGGERQRERERQRETETERQRQRDTQRETETERQRQRDSPGWSKCERAKVGFVCLPILPQFCDQVEVLLALKG